MCDERTEFASDVAPVALLEIVTLNRELRDLRAATAEASASRRREYEAHVASLHSAIRDQDREIELLRAKVLAVTPYVPPRHVAEEIGLRTPDARAAAAESAARDRAAERRVREFDGLLRGAEQLRDGMAKASGLVSPKEPDQK